MSAPDVGRVTPLTLAFLSLGARATGPLVLTCEHASRRLPAPLVARATERAVLASHWGWDLGAWPLTRLLAHRFRATAVGGRWSRLFYDLNRRPGEPTAIRREAGGVSLSWNAGLTRADADRRTRTTHAPYHAEVDRRIRSHLARGVRPLVFSIHTFTAELDGQPRPFDAGVLFDEHEGAARRLAAALRATGLDVRLNRPYSGRRGLMYSADRHGRAHGLPCLELEIKQTLLGSERGVARIGSAVTVALRALLARS